MEKQSFGSGSEPVQSGETCVIYIGIQWATTVSGQVLITTKHTLKFDYIAALWKMQQ